MDSVKVLRKALSKRKKNVVEDGTVVRFVSGGVYSYAAIYVNNRWYLTGNGYYFGGNVFTNEDFMENVLGNSGTDNVEIATSFEEVG